MNEAQVGTGEPDTPSSTSQRRAGMIAVFLLIVAGLFTVGGFLPALAWAVVFAVALWPWFDRLAARWPQHRHELLPLSFVLGVLLIFVIPLAILAVPLIKDAHEVGQWIGEARQTGLPTPPVLQNLPFGDRLASAWHNNLGHPGGASSLWTRELHGGMLSTARGLGSQLLHRFVLLGFMLLTLFFLLRESEAVIRQARVASARAFGPRGERVGAQMILSVHGTVNGLVLVGVGEGALLGIIYWLTGVPHPALFGLLTAVLAAIPFGAPLAFCSAALLLLGMSEPVHAGIVAGVGFAISFAADHFVRPVLIGGATRLPFLWVLLGILGGLEAWGLLGLFLGPAIMAALIMLWREWVGTKSGPVAPAPEEHRTTPATRS